MADPRQLPWIYPYREDPPSTRLGQPVFRRLCRSRVRLLIAARLCSMDSFDTGADAILASDLIADQLELDLTDNDGETVHAVGGRTVTARYKTVDLRVALP